MGDIDHAGKRLGRAGMRRHELGAVKNPDEVILDDDIEQVRTSR